MLYQFEPVRESSAYLPYRYVVVYQKEAVTHRRYFIEEDKAEAWRDWAIEVTSQQLPTGVTLDIRHKHPFLARKRIKKVRHSRYCNSVEDAIRWQRYVEDTFR